MKHLVLIHGRSQEMKDAGKLKKNWVEGLKKGLDNAGVSLPLDEEKIHFPYYGDTLIGLMNNVADPAAVIVKGSSNATTPEQDFTMGVLREMLGENGVADGMIEKELEQGDASRIVRKKGPLNWPWILAGLRVLDRLNGGAWAVSTFTHDVYTYLTDEDIQEKINNGVTAAFGGEPTVVVAHSLGTIVAYMLLKSDQAKFWNVPALITLGSPLAVTAIAERVRPLERPACIGQWFNGRDEHDTVALFSLAAPRFPVEPITAKNNIQNSSENHHGIESYLADIDVARWIYDALRDS